MVVDPHTSSRETRHDSAIRVDSFSLNKNIYSPTDWSPHAYDDQAERALLSSTSLHGTSPLFDVLVKRSRLVEVMKT